MDYVPSREFLELAHKKKIQNAEVSPKICVGFVDEGATETIIRISAARNDAGVKAAIEGPLTDKLTSEPPQTAYIPGLAGLAKSETVLATPVLHRRAASGEGGSVLRHILLELAGGAAGTGEEYKELLELNNWVGKVVSDVRFWVKYDRRRDVIIDAQFLTSDMRSHGKSITQQRKPLEMAGTGFLQIVQIFAYLLTYKPKLLLIDEPDAHLHPGTQERLIRAIEDATSVFPETQFILTTHSPSLVRACGAKTRVHWMDNGQLKRTNEDTTRQRMGWGALDKDIILFSEDEKLQTLKSIIDQWPDPSRKILLWPTFGASGLQSGDALAKLRNALEIPVIVHRDRDFMSDNDVTEWVSKKGYRDNAIPIWITPGSDIEASFCTPEQIEHVFKISREDSEQIIKEAINSIDSVAAEKSFNTALQSATASIPMEGRSAPSARWRELGGFGTKTVKGKELLRKIEYALKNKFAGTPEARSRNVLF